MHVINSLPNCRCVQVSSRKRRPVGQFSWVITEPLHFGWSLTWGLTVLAYLLIDWFIIFHFTHPKQRVPRLLNNNIKTKHRILTSQSFQKIWLESKWYLPFSSSRGKFFGSNRTSKIKVVLFFQMECSRWKFKFPFFKPSLILVSGFCSGFSVLKWNWFV